MDAAYEALNLLGAGRYFKTEGNSSQQLWFVIERGLPMESLERVLKPLPPASRKRWHELVTSNGPTLSTADSEKLGRLASILATAKEVWGEWKPAMHFLSHPHPELGGRSPLDAAESEHGAKEVERVLRSIQYGLPA